MDASWWQVLVTRATGGGLTIIGGYFLERFKRKSDEEKRRVILAQDLCVEILGQFLTMDTLAGAESFEVLRKDPVEFNEEVVQRIIEIHTALSQKASHLRILGFHDLGITAERIPDKGIDVLFSDSEENRKINRAASEKAFLEFQGKCIVQFGRATKQRAIEGGQPSNNEGSMNIWNSVHKRGSKAR